MHINSSISRNAETSLSTGYYDEDCNKLKDKGASSQVHFRQSAMCMSLTDVSTQRHRESKDIPKPQCGPLGTWED